MATSDPFAFFGNLFGKALPQGNCAADVLRAGVAHAQSPDERARYVGMGMSEAEKDRDERRLALLALALLGIGCVAVALVRARAG